MMAMTAAPGLAPSTSFPAGRLTLSTMSAPASVPAASETSVAPADWYSASIMPDFTPAPAWTATSAPSPIYFFTVSGVAATRVSLGSASVGTAIRIKVSANVGKPQRQGPSGPSTSKRQESEDNEDHDAV